MESDNALNQTLAALGGDITTSDLDEMLEEDMLVSLDTSDIMSNNAQSFPSQLNDSNFDNNNLNEGGLYRILDSLEAQILNTNTNDHSVTIIKDDEMEPYDVNDVTDDVISSTNNCQPVDLSKVPSVPTSQQSFGTLSIKNAFLETFNRERASKQNELVFSNDENEENFENRTNYRRDLEKPTTSKAAKQVELKFFTQLKPPNAEQNKSKQNISSSCPNQETSVERNMQSNTLIFEHKKSLNDNGNKNKDLMLNLFSNVSDDSHNKADDFHMLDDVQNSDKSSKETESSSHAQSQLEASDDVGQQTTTDATKIPQSIKRLYDLMKARYSDFAFVYALSAQLCQDRVPMACYVNVKMGLLLSIASCGKNSNVAPIPIIVMGSDSYMANLLIMNIADLADRFVGPVDDVKPMPSTEGYRNHIWIEADPIQLAKGGVYYVGDWSCMKSTRSEKIFKDIEMSRVVVQRTTSIYPLETAIWAHWRAFKYNAKDQQLFNKFVKIFGIPICMDDNNHETLVDFMLKQASTEKFESTIDHLSVSADDVREFLAIISKRTVDFTTEAMTLLQKYFVASRSERPDCLTKQAFCILKQFAESFAKLSLRHEVVVIDAIGAIFLCEDFIQHIYGSGRNPPPILEDDHYVGNVDAFIAKFYEWLKVYIEKYYEK